MVQKLIEDEENVEQAQIVTAAAVSVYILACFSLVTYTLSNKSYAHHIKHKRTGKLILGVDLRSRFGKFYFSMFLFRFFVFILISSIFCLNPVFEI